MPLWRCRYCDGPHRLCNSALCDYTDRCRAVALPRLLRARGAAADAACAAMTAAMPSACHDSCASVSMVLMRCVSALTPGAPRMLQRTTRAMDAWWTVLLIS